MAFQGRSLLLFGGAKGIGRAVALEFAARGAAVAVADIDSGQTRATVADIEAAGGCALALDCDVRDSDSMRAAVAATESAFDRVDIVINNVGVMMSGNPEDIPLAEWQRILDLNLLSAVRSNEILLPKMLARGSGHIVNTASFAGLYPYAVNRTPYAAAKAALISLTESLALYLQPQGIRVSCFCPGPVITTVSKNIKHWSEQTQMTGPGSDYRLLTAAEAAIMLAEGMAAGRIFIPTHDHVTDAMQQHAADPDAFIRRKLQAFAEDDNGLPTRS